MLVAGAHWENYVNFKKKKFGYNGMVGQHGTR